MQLDMIPAEPWHATIMAPRVREADKREIWASGGIGVEAALRISVERSTHAWTAFVDGDPACMWGCGPATAMSEDGTAWMVGGPEVERFPFRFLRENRKFLAEMLGVYPVLRNHVDARNVVAIRWLEWLGAEFEEPAPFGFARLPFRAFTIRPGRGLLRAVKSEPQEAA